MLRLVFSTLHLLLLKSCHSSAGEYHGIESRRPSLCDSRVIIKQTGNWRICYYVMIGFQVINLTLLFFFYNPPSWKEKKTEHGKSARELLREFDWLGMFLFLAGCTMFIVGVSWGGSMAPWVSATVLCPIIIGLLTLIGLGFYEAYYPLTAPLFPPRLFRALRHFTVPMLVMGKLSHSYICRRW